MSRLSLRSVAVLGFAAAAPLATHYYAGHSNSATSGLSQSTLTGLSALARNNAAAPAPEVSSPASPNASELDKATTAGQQAGNASLVRTVCGFLAQYAGTPPAPPSGAARKTSTTAFPCATAPATTPAAAAAAQPWLAPRVMLAIVADPARTHLELRFDRAVDELQDAAQESGWEFDSSWIPWDPRSHTEAGRFGDRLLDQAARHGREKNPGVLLFRPGGTAIPTSQPAPDPAAAPQPAASAATPNSAAGQTPAPLPRSPADAPLIMLVIGDSPVSGVNADQFRTALALWRALAPLSAEPRDLRIFGPTFSGSVSSLMRLLPPGLAGAAPNTPGPNASRPAALPAAAAAAPRSQPPQGNTASRPPPKPALCGNVAVHIASGTITGSSQLTGLQSVCPNTSVISFAIDGRYEANLLLTYLRERNPFKRIAQLAEEQTTYGQTLARSSDPKPAAPAPDLAGHRGAPRPKTAPERGPDLLLRFPHEISRLREAYEKNGIIGFTEAADSPHSQLQFITTEQQHGTDTIPDFSGTQQTLSMEAEMAQLADTLSAQRISIALLSATDVFDEIFVARYLQQHAPRVTVIIQDADLLFLRRGPDASLQNTFVASPWPLILENQQWTRPVSSPDFHVFPSQGDEGGRAAALTLLCPGCPPQEYRSPFSSPPEFQNRPPLWLSLVGRGLFAPIALVDSDLRDPGQQPTANLANAPSTNLPPLPGVENPAQGVYVELPLQLKLLVALVAGLLLWHGAACLFSRLDRRFAWSYALADAGQRGHRLWVQSLLSLFAVPILWILRVPNTPEFVLHTWRLTSVIFVLQALALILAAWSLLRWWFGRNPQPPARRVLPIAVTAILLLVFAIAIDTQLWIHLEPSAATERTFFLYRSALMTPGVSPSLTLLLLMGSLAIWGHSYFSRWAFFGHRIPDLPNHHLADLNCPSPSSVAPVTNLFTNVEPARMFPPMRRTNLYIAALSALLVSMVLWISNSSGPTSLENDTFDLWARALTTLLAAVILNDIGVAVWGWGMLHQFCLLPLKRSPLRWGFTWIKGFSWRRLWTSSYVLSPELVFDYLSRVLEANSRTWAHSNVISAAHQRLLDGYFAPGPKNDAWGYRVAEDLVALHARLAAHADLLLNDLKILWANDHGPLTGSTEPDRGVHLPKDDETLALNRKAAEEFVALLYVGYIRMVLIQIRNRIVTALICYVLLVWALTSYSWTNHHAIIVGMSALLAVISGGVIYIYSGMHRDEILSRTTETEPGKLDSEFFEKTIPTLGIPLLSLAATQFPEFSDLIFSWIEPGLRGH